MFDHCDLGGRRLAPARFAAPMAGYTHSAYRRLLGDWGGCGAVWTEMLAARQILAEDFRTSPWVKRRPGDGLTVYQLMVRAGDPLDQVLARLANQGIEAVDLNLACDAFSVRACEAGSGLFEDLKAMARVVTEARRCWPGLLTAKVRLGSRRPDWQARFSERVRLLEENGFDALIVHPRFFEDKFGRRAQHELLPWVSTVTRLPLIANGDLVNSDAVRGQAPRLQHASAIMVGRMAIAQPWLFARWGVAGPIDHAEVWRRLCGYIEEDFPPATALRRVSMFTRYFAANFAFGHQFWVDVGKAPDLADARRRAEAFFARGPTLLAHPVVAGVH